jgi:LysR family glycine cleavage system transcriptional activator
VNRTRLPSVAALIAFETAARYGSISKAASELHLTQGAISRQVRQLEEQLGTELFHRQHQRVVLTDAGRSFLEEIRPTLDALDVATQRVMSYGIRQNELKLAVPPTFSATWLAARLPRFLDAHPGITISCLMRVPWLDYGAERFDAAIYFGTPTLAGVSTTPVVECDMPPLCAPAFKAARIIEQASDLAGVPLLHQANQPMAWTEWFADAGVTLEQPPAGSRIEHVGMICRAAAAGAGVALLPTCLVEDELAAGDLVEALPGCPRRRVTFSIAVPDAKAASPAVRLFSDWLIAEARR